MMIFGAGFRAESSGLGGSRCEKMQAKVRASWILARAKSTRHPVVNLRTNPFNDGPSPRQPPKAICMLTGPARAAVPPAVAGIGSRDSDCIREAVGAWVGWGQAELPRMRVTPTSHADDADVAGG